MVRKGYLLFKSLGKRILILKTLRCKSQLWQLLRGTPFLSIWLLQPQLQVQWKWSKNENENIIYLHFELCISSSHTFHVLAEMWLSVSGMDLFSYSSIWITVAINWFVLNFDTISNKEINKTTMTSLPLLWYQSNTIRPSTVNTTVISITKTLLPSSYL